MTRRMLNLLVLSVFCGAVVVGSPQVFAQDPPVKGQWGPLLDWPLAPIHMVLLKNGKVLCTSGIMEDTAPTPWILFDPSDESVSEVFYTPEVPGFPEVAQHNLFCSGHSDLPDGKIVFNGGRTPFGNKTTIYTPDPVTNGTFDVLQELAPALRFYPTLTTLWDGTILAMAGHITDDSANTPAIFDNDPAMVEQWRSLPGAEYCGPSPAECPGAPGGPYDFHLRRYPFMFQLSTGSVLYSGERITGFETLKTRTIDTVLETWTDLFPVPDDILGGSAVMYLPDRVIKAGGLDGVSHDRIKDAYRLDTRVPSPAWEALPPMTYARGLFYLIALADGKVLALGGEEAVDPVVIPPELMDPTDAAPVWTEMALMDPGIPRPHHPTAVLLPDARVLFAGGNCPVEEPPGPLDCPSASAQIFSPPYLFAVVPPGPTRPEIDAVTTPGQPADTILYGKGFTITTTPPEAAADITAVSLIRLGTATHGFDQDQRFLTLNFKTSATALKGAAPAHSYIAPPGYYMLFILDDGVPSVARIVKLMDVPI